MSLLLNLVLVYSVPVSVTIIEAVQHVGKYLSCACACNVQTFALVPRRHLGGVTIGACSPGTRCEMPNPPSTVNVVPLMYVDLSEARKLTASAISCDRPNPQGKWWCPCSSTCCQSGVNLRSPSVSIQPGATVFTCILCWVNALAMLWAKLFSAALEAL